MLLNCRTWTSVFQLYWVVGFERIRIGRFYFLWGDSNDISNSFVLSTNGNNAMPTRTIQIMQNNRLTLILLGCTFLLLIPLIAMQFTNEVNWTRSDFVVAGALLFGTGLMCEFVLRKVDHLKFRIAFCAALLVFLILVWAELAVGIFGTPFGGH